MSKANNGGNNTGYNIPKWVKNVDDLNDHLESDTPMGNILKSLFSNIMDRHAGTTKIRDAKKMLHYSIRRILKLRRPKEPNIRDVDVLVELFKELSPKKQKYFKKKIKQ